MGDILQRGGTKGGLIVTGCIPDATFLAELKVLIAADTEIENLMVGLTFADNYEVTSPADGAAPDGIIIAHRETSAAAGSSYELTVRMINYTDQNGNLHAPVAVQTFLYSTVLALQDTVVIDGADYKYVKDGTTGGFGVVISVDTTNTEVDVLI